MLRSSAVAVVGRSGAADGLAGLLPILPAVVTANPNAEDDYQNDKLLHYI